MPVPDVEVLLGLEPEEAGARILIILRDIIRNDSRGMVHFTNHKRQIMGRLLGVSEHGYSIAGQGIPREPEVEQVLTEAWAWLEAQGLLVPAPDPNGHNGFRILSRRARRFSSLADFVPYQIARRLDPAMLNPRIRDEVWAAFIRGHFEVAAGIAMKAVEVAVKEATKAGDDLYGVPLVAKAFNPADGELTDRAAHPAEQKAMRDLFVGAIGARKNPHSHRKVDLDDATEGLEVVMLANHLLRIVDRQAAAPKVKESPRAARRPS